MTGTKKDQTPDEFCSISFYFATALGLGRLKNTEFQNTTFFRFLKVYPALVQGKVITYTEEKL